MSDLSLAPVVALLADAAVKGTLLLLAALGLTRLMRGASAAARHFVWLAALAGVVALPVAGAVMPAWEVLPFADPFASVESAPVVAAETPAPAASPATADAGDASATPQPSVPAVSPSDASVSQGTETTPAPTVSSDGADAGFGGLGWMGWLAMAWGAGAAVLGLRLAYGVARVWWLERAAREITDDGWLHLADGLARRLRLGRMVTLLRAGEASVPMTWGVLRPVVLLPDSADGWDDSRRTVVLAHELAHVGRWDALTQWVAHLAMTLFWFHPLVWVACRRMREEREHACDDAVLAIGARPADYADHLLSLVRSLGRAEGPVAALAMARRSQFEGRLLAILDHATPRGGLSRGLGLATLAGALALVAPLAALRGAVPASPASLASPAVVETGETGGDAPASPFAATDAGDAAGQGAEPAGTTGDDAAAPVTQTAAADPVLMAVVKSLPSDGKRATVLVEQLEADETRRTDYAAIIRAAETIRSAEDRMRVLNSVLEQGDATPADGALVLGATHSMGSDSYRRIVITRAVERGWITDAGFRAAFVRAAAHVASPMERRIVMWSVLEGPRLDAGTLAALLNLVPAMRASSMEQRLVLQRAAENQTVEGRARDAYLAAAATIASDVERSLALTALADAGPRPAPSRGAAATGTGRPATQTGRVAASRPSTWDADTETSYTRDGRDYHLRIRARDVVGGWDGSPIHTIRPGGSLYLELSCAGERRVVRMNPRQDGSLNVVYTINGEARPFDAEAERWLLDTILGGTGR